MFETRKKFEELLKLSKENRERRYEYYENSQNIPERVGALLVYFGVNKKTLGLMICVSESTIKRWLRGQGTKRVNRLLSLRKLEEMFLEYSNGLLKIGHEYMWYNCKNECLGNLTPIECIIQYQYEGMKRVAGLLNAIKYGITS